MQTSNTCTCGLQTITSSPDKYGEVGWGVADIHDMREEMELPKWEDHEAEAFLEVHEDTITELMVHTGWEWIRDLLQDGEDE